MDAVVRGPVEKVFARGLPALTPHAGTACVSAPSSTTTFSPGAEVPLTEFVVVEEKIE
jgi:hypothetical protein